MRSTAKIVLLLLVLLVGGGIAWAVRSNQQQQASEDFEHARFIYKMKAGMERVHDDVERRLIMLGKRKTTLTDDDHRIYREARDAEQAYVEACKRCASAAECEQDRRTVAIGSASDTYNPCN